VPVVTTSSFRTAGVLRTSVRSDGGDGRPSYFWKRAASLGNSLVGRSLTELQMRCSGLLSSAGKKDQSSSPPVTAGERVLGHLSCCQGASDRCNPCSTRLML